MIRTCDWVEITKDINQKDWQIKIYTEKDSFLLKAIKKINFYGDFRIEILDNCINISPSTGNQILCVELNQPILYIAEHPLLEEA